MPMRSLRLCAMLALAQGHLDVIDPTFQPVLQEGEIWNGQERQEWRPRTTVQGRAHSSGPRLVGLATSWGTSRWPGSCHAVGSPLRVTETQDGTAGVTGWIHGTSLKPMLPEG